jgi:predicted short-subunit dehydrogenase-like oxidoreductase (DUF2520 family)
MCMTTPPAYRQIGILGSGRVAQAMGAALADQSRAPLLMWGRTQAKVQRVADRIGHARAAPDCAALAASCDLIVLAVADDALEDIVAQLAAQAMAQRPFIIHVSGKNGVALLEPLRRAGAQVAAIHPAMTFTGDPQAERLRMAGAVFAVTTIDNAALAQAQQLVGLLGGVLVQVTEERRALYHAALCHAANHLVTLLAGAREALTAAGIARPQDVMAPLVQAAMDNSLVEGMGALSGPLLRGDRGTIERHLDALANDFPALLPAYRGMASATLEQLARQGHVPDPTLWALLTRSPGD